MKQRNIALGVTRAAERHIRRGHPWLFADAIIRQSHDGPAGNLAVVFDRQRNFLALGLYDPDSPIRVKLLHHGKPRTIDNAFWAERLAHAAARRADLVARGTNGYRVVNGENDGLPGLILDRYADTLVLKLYAPIWWPYLDTLLPLTREQIPAQRLVLRLSRRLAGDVSAPHADGTALWGDLPDRPIVYRENGLSFEADVVHGQKTGAFLDQRDNRMQVRDLSRDRRVLDLFACTGGFSVYAAAGGARSVLAVDSSEGALAAAWRNWQRNATVTGGATFETAVADVFDTLASLSHEGRRFDLVIVDPPSFAKRQSEVERAEAAYRKLIRGALAVLQSGGILVAASCSSRVPAGRYFKIVEDTAATAGRPLRSIARTEHAVDHPVSFREGAYLKCLFAYA